MKRNKKYIVPIILLVLFITVGYALATGKLTIGGTSVFKQNSWEIVWDDIQIKKNVTYQDEGVEKVGTVDYTDASHTGIEYEAALLIPGDKFEFTVDMYNKGTIPAYVTLVDRNTKMEVNEIVTTSYSNWFNYSINYTDGKVIKPLNTLQPGERKNVTVTLELKADITNEDLQKLPSTFEGGISIKYEQYSENKTLDKTCLASSEVSLGSEINCANEVFNVIASDTDTYTLLSKESIDLETDKQSVTGGKISYSKDAYWWDTENDSMKDSYTTDYVYDNNSKIYEHLDNYKHFFYINNLNVDVVLPNITDLTKSVCTYDVINNVSNCDTSTYAFLGTKSIWLGNAFDSEKMYVLDKDNGITRDNYNTQNTYAIRPIIVVNKTDVGVTE